MGEPDLSAVTDRLESLTYVQKVIAEALGVSYGLEYGTNLWGLVPQLAALRPHVQALAPAVNAMGAELRDTLRALASKIPGVDQDHPLPVHLADPFLYVHGVDALYPPLVQIATAIEGATLAMQVLASWYSTYYAYGITPPGTPASMLMLLGQPGAGGMADFRGPVTVDAGEGFKPLAVTLPEWAEKLAKAALAALEQPPEGGNTEKAVQNALNELTGGTFPALSLFGLKSAAPEDGPTNCEKAYLATATVGLTAAKFFAWLATLVPSKVAYVFQSLAKISGEMAGYDRVNEAILNAVGSCLLTRPMQYHCNDQFRPALPGVGEAVNLYWSRRLPDSPGGDSLGKAPRKARELLRFAGYSEPWIDTLLDAGHRDLGLRELVGAHLVAPKDEEWMDAKLRDLGYEEGDLYDLKWLVRWRAEGGAVNDVLGEMERQYERGFVTLENFTGAMKDMNYPAALVDLRTRAAQARQWTWVQQKCLDTTLDEYASGRISDALFEQRVGEVVADETVAAQLIEWWKGTRYQKMPLLATYGAAREIRDEARRALLFGLYEWGYYKAILVDLGWTAEGINLEEKLTTEERNRQIVADLRSYFLPAKRDAVLEGTLTPAGYAAWLEKQEMPPAVRSAEVAYMTAARDRRVRGRIERYQIPSVEAAYVEGLVLWSACVNLMRAAGYSAGEIADRRDILSLRRDRNLDARRVRGARMLAASTRTEEAEAKARQQEAARAAAAALRAKAAILKSKDPAAVAAAADLVALLDAVYEAAHALMPGGIWTAALAVQDAATDPEGIDPETVAALALDLYSALETQAGEAQ